MINWEKFPPSPEDAARLRGYEACHSLYKGDQGPIRYNGAKLLNVQGVSQRFRQIGIIENFPKTVSQISSALLFGRKPTFTVGPNASMSVDIPDDTEDEGGQDAKTDSPAQQALNEIVRANQFTTLLKESAISQSKDGDSVFRVRWGLPPKEKGERVIIEELPASNYFVTTNPYNPREVISQQIAWLVPRRDADGNLTGHGFLCCQEHLPGQVNNLAFFASNNLDGTWTVGDDAGLNTVYDATMIPSAQVNHEYPGALLFHIPNERICSQYFGDSDYLGLETIFEAINNRISKIDQYLDKHANPKLVSIPGIMNQNGTVDFDDLEYIETAQTELAKYLPRYVTWDGQITGSIQQLEHLLETFCRVSRLAPAFFGLDKAGSIESGVAMRMRFFSTTSKIDDKQTYYDPVVRQILRAALDLHMEHTKVNTEGDVEIFWRHGLPVDDSEMTRNVISRVASQTMARETAICHMDGISRTEAQAEMSRIDLENADAAEAQANNQVAQSKITGVALNNAPKPIIDPLTAQESSPNSSLPAKALKAAEISVVA